MTTEVQRAIESGFESVGHYEESMRDFDRVLDYLDRTENISEERKELYHCSLDEIGMEGVFELARNTNELFKELGINSYRLQQVEHCRNRMELLSDTERIELSRSGGLKSRGRGYWQTHPELLEDIVKFREESIGKGHHTKKKLPSMDYVTAKMNEKYGEDWTTGQVSKAYHNNKHLLPDEEE